MILSSLNTNVKQDEVNSKHLTLFFYLSSNCLVETFIEEFMNLSKSTEAVELKLKKRGRCGRGE